MPREKADLRGLYRRTCARLALMGSDAPEHEALLLCRHCLGISGRADIAVHGDSVPDAESVRRLEECVRRREDTPLQYILGEWEFCGMSLSVGEGVLIPRDDTAALVEAVCEAAAGISPDGRLTVLDLCAGSGAVGLACAGYLPGSRVVCAELSEDAIKYLGYNVRRFGGGRVFVMRADVLEAPRPDSFPAELEPWDGRFDIICSNPPYIRSADIAGLSRDVRREPVMALDGGADGLDFYRAISEKWRAVLKKGGVLAFEIGAGMERGVGEIMRANGFGSISHKKDLSGHVRTIYGTYM